MGLTIRGQFSGSPAYERPRSCPIIEEEKQDDVEKLKQRIKEVENKLDEIYQDKINEWNRMAKHD